MDVTVGEVLKFVENNDVKFIRLAFCDIFGVQKNISIMPDELQRAFDYGISFDASAVKGFLNAEESDLLLRPDPKTLSVLPWRPSHGRVIRFFCNIFRPDGSPFVGDGRAVLKSAVQKAAEKGYDCKIGPECEFYLFELDDNGNPTLTPQDSGSYCDIAPLDKGENVRREICLALDEMGIKPVSSHHEQGPGQNEIDFRYSDALSAADNFITFKSVVRTIAAQNGLYASFMPKPLADKSGNGLHINLSLSKNGTNLFRGLNEDRSTEAESFIAGILRRIKEITVFLNPLTNSYARFGFHEAPKFITWSHQNRSQLIRIPAASGDQLRMELRSPDPYCNPYLAFSLLISAGIEGIENNLSLCPSFDHNMYNPSVNFSGIETLPENLGEAITFAKNSDFVRRVLPEATLNRFLDAKCNEYILFKQADSKADWEHSVYF